MNLLIARNSFRDDPVPPQFADREQIIVVGYARSGNFWLSRLLADVLDSPFASTMQNGLADGEGLDRPGKYVIRQRHWRVKHEPDAKYIFIYRDPRDVVTSMFHFWKHESIEETLHIAARGLDSDGRKHVENRWDFFMGAWMDNADAVISYEDLNNGSFLALLDVIRIQLLIDIDSRDLAIAFERQSFANRKKLEPESPLLRKGKIGDWRNHFSKSDARIAANYFNYWLIYLGYESTTDWYKEITNE